MEHMLTVGAGDNVVRLLPPLTIEEAHLDDAMERLSRACTAIEAAMGAPAGKSGAGS